MRSAALALMGVVVAVPMLAACGSSGGEGSTDAKDCSALTGQRVAVNATAQITTACSRITISNGFFPCSVAGKSVGQIYYVKTKKGNYAGRTGGTWVRATATQAEKLGTMAKLAGCDVS